MNSQLHAGAHYQLSLPALFLRQTESKTTFGPCRPATTTSPPAPAGAAAMTRFGARGRMGRRWLELGAGGLGSVRS
jgi:hypothetical protein